MSNWLDEHDRKFLTEKYGFGKQCFVETVKLANRGFSIMSAAAIVNKQNKKKQG